MANFLRSFATGFVTSANVQFDERRKALAAKDLVFADLATKAFSSYNTAKSSAAKSKTDLERSRAVLTPQIAGAAPGANLAAAMVFNNLLDSKQVPDFLANIPPEMKERLAADPFQFTPGQTGIPDITTALKNAGIPDKNIQEFFKGRNIDPSQFPGQAAVAPQVTGGPEGFDVTQAFPSPQDQRVEKLATTFIGKANMFASNQDFNQAKLAFRQGDFETVLDLTARSPNVQNNIFLPILEQILESGIDSLNDNQRVLLDLYRPRDPLDQIMNMVILQNRDTFEQIIKDAIEAGEITEPPGPDASDEENFDWWEQNITPMLNRARREWDKIISGRKQ